MKTVGLSVSNTFSIPLRFQPQFLRPYRVELNLEIDQPVSPDFCILVYTFYGASISVLPFILGISYPWDVVFFSRCDPVWLLYNYELFTKPPQLGRI